MSDNLTRQIYLYHELAKVSLCFFLFVVQSFYFVSHLSDFAQSDYRLIWANSNFYE